MICVRLSDPRSEFTQPIPYLSAHMVSPAGSTALKSLFFFLGLSVSFGGRGGAQTWRGSRSSCLPSVRVRVVFVSALRLEKSENFSAMDSINHIR